MQLSHGLYAISNLNYHTNNTRIENFRVNSRNELTENANIWALSIIATRMSQTTNAIMNVTNGALLHGDATLAAVNMRLTNAFYTATAACAFFLALFEPRGVSHASLAVIVALQI
jgi:hypothetical protein